ncbi:MAG: AAA family ATPase [Desulfomonile tiedjei]|uniref:Uncharacterized AAA domain-containing protein ycf46 n=1 Tax=Desulfomonile tiedjei TaxID=2358 RepID=A0A9D6Z628_9BACT|nr:AAA family ATPase [Desulfomonile tiedjei]
MKTKLIHYIRAGYAGLSIVSPEEQRVEAIIKQVAGEVGYGLHAWSVTDGLLDTVNGTIKEINDPMDVLLAIEGLPEKNLILLRDFHLFLGNDPNPVLVRKLKDVLHRSKTEAKTMLLLGCRCELPPELQREVTTLTFSLPGREELEPVLEGLLESAPQLKLKPQEREQLLEATRGLTTIEAENALALSIVETGKMVPAIIHREKAHALKQNGLLEIVDSPVSIAAVGGLDQLKGWLQKRKTAFSKEAKAYGLPAPKGMLVFGVSGTGKSLTAKATASVFDVPLLRLDVGRLFGSLVGQTESNLRLAIQTAEAIAPVCLWLDEIEKAFSGSKSSGQTDGGTSARAFGSFLSWMQEKTSSVFVVATANEVSQLPPELLRRGRFDEVWFVDLPNQQERESIWSIQIQKYGRKAREFDTTQLARVTEGLTGAEIEQVWIEAMHEAFQEKTEPSDLTISSVLNEFVPLSKLMGEEIEGLRRWAKGRARPATTPVIERRSRKLSLKEGA